MAIKTLRTFQKTAIDGAVEVFTYAKEMLDAAKDDADGRANAIYDNGYLLIEAPTGSGKTLMAGHIAEKMASVDQIVWFWFAPFKGVVDQTASVLREQFTGLRLRTLAEDRLPSGTRAGDVFVTTWQMVATRVTDRRNVRKSGEQNPSVDELIESLREQGMRIGVVVDEAHHTFKVKSQAAAFFRGVLKPEYTILVTATPDDDELEELREQMQVKRIHRIGVSRTDAVVAGLIKDGVKCVTWTADENSQRIVDFEATALREGATLHKAIKAQLQAAGINLVPLMLVQVASNERSVERAKEKLLGLGFTDSQIAIHTAAEPDAGLLGLANDESREVLIFKMAVALGFDAPRAWTLVSMRAAHDEDFGVQLVGRILRVHRRLQGRKVPETLRYGYVLLADAESQTGIDAAGQRINQLRTEYAKLSPTTVVVRVGDQDTVQYVGPSGQMSLLPVPAPGAIWTPPPERPVREGESQSRPADEDLFAFSERQAAARGEPLAMPIAFALPSPSMGAYRYPLRAGVPRRFKTHELPEDLDVTEEECAAKFVVSADDLLQALIVKDKVQMQKRTLEIFTKQVQLELAFTPPSPAQLKILAQRELFRSEVFHPKDLRVALLRRLQVNLQERGFADANDPQRLAEFLDVLLATRPELLREAQKEALAKGAGIEDAAPLPEELQSEEPLPTSRFNVYGAMPEKMNSWEQDFTKYLDSDTSDTVLWWHRNEVHKPWSIKVLLPSGAGFFPDFIIGINHRRKDDHGLLADTKYAYDRNVERPKIDAEHPAYGRALILARRNEDHRWSIARINKQNQMAELGEPFRFSDAPHY